MGIKLNQFLRDWSLPIAMTGGVVMYLLYVNIPLFDSTHAVAADIISVVQPGLIFAMLFVTFCKVRIKELKPAKWHLWLLLFQIISFIVLSSSIALFQEMGIVTKSIAKISPGCTTEMMSAATA